jgi:hypothetical protein
LLEPCAEAARLDGSATRPGARVVADAGRRRGSIIGR